MFIVVAVVFSKLNVLTLVVKSPPLTARSPVIVVLLRIVVVPVTAPIVIVVPSPAKLTTVAVVFNKLNVVALVVKSPPSILTSPSTSKLLLTLVVPVAAPSSKVVAAPNALTVVAVVLAKLNVVVDTVRSPPSILTSPSTSKLLLILVVPVLAPILISVPSPAKLTIGAFALIKLNVPAVVVRSPPLTARSPWNTIQETTSSVPVISAFPAISMLPPKNKLPDIPAPPVTTNEPLVVSVLDVL